MEEQRESGRTKGTADLQTLYDLFSTWKGEMCCPWQVQCIGFGFLHGFWGSSPVANLVFEPQTLGLS